MFVCAIIHLLQIFESSLIVETKLYKVVVGWFQLCLRVRYLWL